MPSVCGGSCRSGTAAAASSSRTRSFTRTLISALARLTALTGERGPLRDPFCARTGWCRPRAREGYTRWSRPARSQRTSCPCQRARRSSDAAERGGPLWLTVTDDPESWLTLFWEKSNQVWWVTSPMHRAHMVHRSEECSRPLSFRHESHGSSVHGMHFQAGQGEEEVRCFIRVICRVRIRAPLIGVDFIGCARLQRRRS